MALILAGDIGGTKTVLRLCELPNGDGSPDGFQSLQILHENRYGSHDYPDLVPMVQQFLAEASPHPLAIQAACFGIAGPVLTEPDRQTCKLTNLGWTLESDRLSQQLDIPALSLINDFVAVGYGVLGLTPADLCTLQAGTPQPRAPIAVIGAGTGLGQGFLVYQGEDPGAGQPGGYQVYPSEGGHADFAPRTELEFQLLRYLLEKHNIQRVSVERVVSGLGILSIYQFLRDRHITPPNPEVEAVVQAWEQQIGRSDKSVDPGAAIGQAALAQGDRLSEQTLELFIAAYGAEAGNLALKLLPYGGLYVAGGIAPKILPLIQAGEFMHAFADKGRMRSLVDQVPVHIVTNPQVGLVGAAVYAHRLGLKS
jgi:glucokinase